MIAIGSDHAGFALKQEIARHLEQKGVVFKDYGTHTTQSCSYTDAAVSVAGAINNGDAELGILVCGTGVGISIAANKVKGIRAACCADIFTAKYTRLHNDSQILCMGARVTGAGVALEMVDVFLATEYEGGRHQLRVDAIKAIEDSQP